jgi:hypothetical protein
LPDAEGVTDGVDKLRMAVTAKNDNVACHDDDLFLLIRLKSGRSWFYRRCLLAGQEQVCCDWRLPVRANSDRKKYRPRGVCGLEG